MQVLEIRGDDALAAVSMGDKHGLAAPIWLLLIASVAFRPLDQFCNSWRGFVAGSHFGLEGCGMHGGLASLWLLVNESRAFSSARCLWCWGAGCLTGKRACGDLRLLRALFGDSRAGVQCA